MSSSNSRKKGRIVRLIIAAILIAGLLISIIWYKQIDVALGLAPKQDESAHPSEDGVVTEELGNDLLVHFLDVGQGDSCIIELPDNKTILIDAAENKTESKKAIFDYIEQNVKDENGETIKWFDYVILTHPDADHCGGMADVLTKYPAKVFYRPNVFFEDKADAKNPLSFTDPETDIKELGSKNIKDTQTYGKALQAAYEGKLPNNEQTKVIITDATDSSTNVIAPDLKETDPNYYSLKFYAPVGKKSYSDWNDYSPIMILTYHDKKFMLSGDAEKNAEADFVAEAAKKEGIYSIFDENFTVDIFKLGHHGSSTSSSEDFIKTMTTPGNCPNVLAIISCGKDNKYGHPHKEVLNRLKNLGFSDENILRTDEKGTIEVAVKGKNAADGTATYSLYVSGSAVSKKLVVNFFLTTWWQIAIFCCIVVVIVFLILPEIRNLFRRKK